MSNHRQNAEAVETTALPNGVRVVTEQMPEARSVTCGVWVGVGGRDEPAQVAGASHFLEHLLFKGSERRSAREIAEAIEAVGGEMNAFTAREHTAYYARLPERELRFGLDLLCDVLAAPALRSHEVDAEREVILEELLAAEDNPEDVVQRLLGEALFPDHSLGRDVLGTAETIAAMTRDDIASFFGEWYRPANLVIAAAGKLTHAEVVDAVGTFIDDSEHGDVPKRAVPDAAPVRRVALDRPFEQANLAMGWRTFAFDDPDRYALTVLNQALGGGLSSRLFQEVREERGLVYAIYSYTSLYADSGVLAVHAGTAPGKVDDVVAVIGAELDDIRTAGITQRERDIAVGFLEGSLLLGLEDSGSRMGRIGKSQLLRGRVVPVEEQIAGLRAVTLDDVARVVDRVLGEYTLALVGPGTQLGSRP